jgi:formylmethanofuran dehydrogenase subunit E
MTIEVELKEIKSLLSKVNKKLDSLLEERETEILTVHQEETLKEFLEEEPDIYSIKDVKTKVSRN